MKEIESLLIQTKGIIDKYNQELLDSGDAFNIFSIMSMENNEVYTHSALIAELLNPKGKHNEGTKFLDLFLEIIEVDNFDSINSDVHSELYSGSIRGRRTFIDICIKDNKSNVIAIENKIWAIEQEQQLLRYSESFPNQELNLFYLTLYGYESEEGSLPIEKYKTISYREHIRTWIERCILATQKSIVKEVLVHYLNLIKKLTNQSIYHKMENELSEIIKSSEANFLSAKKITEIFPSIRNEIVQKFWNELHKKIPTNQYDEIELKDNLKLKYIIQEENNEPLYLGFRLYTKDDNFIDPQNGDGCQPYFEKMKEINHKFENNVHWFAWMYLNDSNVLCKQRFCDLDDKTLFKYINEAKLSELINEIAEEFSGYINKIKEISF